MTRVAVVGAGTWGTTLATVTARRVPTVLWARSRTTADEISHRCTNSAYLPGVTLPGGLRATDALADAVGEATAVFMAVPSHGFREVLAGAAPHLAPGVPVVSLAKGVEEGTRRRMTEIVGELLPHNPAAVLTGPNLAKEILSGDPTASVIACVDESVATALQAVVSVDNLRVYTNTDVVGCEVAGALKNVVAIAAGMADGLGFGDNTRAALVTRGLAELSRLGTKLGGRPETFAGLAGMGDLVATCISRQSRNRHVGEQLGRGRPLADIVDEMRTVAEGVRSCRPVHDLAARLGVEMPIVEQVVQVIHGGKPAGEAVTALMSRRARPEHEPEGVRP